MSVRNDLPNQLFGIPDLDLPSSTFSRHVTDCAESERIALEREMHREIKESAIRRERSVCSVDVLEEAFYRLISAAALVYLVLGIFGL
jgi:hypothetical protein